LTTDKLLIVQPKVGKNQLNKFIKNLENEGVKHIYVDPKTITDKKSKIKTVFTTSNADYVVIGKDGKKIKGKKIGKQFKILSYTNIHNSKKSKGSSKNVFDFGCWS
jgi:3-dehydroquinate synthase II